jgi:hypothetical protein
MDAKELERILDKIQSLAVSGGSTTPYSQVRYMSPLLAWEALVQIDAICTGVLAQQAWEEARQRWNLD